MELRSITGLARALGVNRQTVHMWTVRRRTNGFPDPVRRGVCDDARLRGGHVTDLYDLGHVQRWREQYVPRHGRAALSSRPHVC